MVIRPHFLGTAMLFSIVLCLFATAPSLADPDFSGLEDPVEVEMLAVATPIDDFDRLRPFPWLQAGAAGTATPKFPEDAELVLPRDPRTEVLAEPGPLAVGPRGTQEPPAYVVQMNEKVQKFVDLFSGSRRDAVKLWFQRAGRYLGMIRAELRRHGLPEDLAYTAMIESGFNPLAVSPAGAKGLWQFMAATARRYGLRVDRWVDERLNPERATSAAVAYLRDLHAQFGSWMLAQAAYNAGAMAVARAVQRTGSDDFWVLARSDFLKKETKDFVPAILAATTLGRNAARYGFEVGDPVDPAVVHVVVPPGTVLRKLATQAGLSDQKLVDLNPEILRGVTPPDTAWKLRVPTAAQASVRTVLLRQAASAPPREAIHPGSRVSRASAQSRVHVVRPRDTVVAIAKHYGVSVGDVVRWNGLEAPDQIHPGDRLRIAEQR